MANVLDHAISHRLLRLAQKLRKKKYRHSYVSAHVRQFLARQMRALRGDDSQEEFGKRIGKAQNVVSRLEDPSRASPNISTLLEIAAKTDRALIVRFVDFQTFLQFTDDQSETAAAPPPYKEFEVDEFAWNTTLSKNGYMQGAFGAQSPQSKNLLLGSQYQVSSSFMKSNLDPLSQSDDEPTLRAIAKKPPNLPQLMLTQSERPKGQLLTAEPPETRQ